MVGNVIDRFDGEHRFLSNFYSHFLGWLGRLWPSAEHAYQWSKTDNFQWKERIRLAASPGQAKILGRQAPLRPGFHEIKVGIMEDIIFAKFADKDLAKKLINTGGAWLIEGNDWGDTFWGAVRVDGKWRGQNHLGKTLMLVRNWLMENENSRLV
jgi:ribA/ribD-fused uncharacterized protein